MHFYYPLASCSPVVKNTPSNAGNLVLTSISKISPGKEHKPIQEFLAWEMPWTDGAWQITAHGVTKELDLT